MNERLEDVRQLKLAELYETSYERFLLEMADCVVQDEGVRSQLRHLAAPARERRMWIAEHLDRLNAGIGRAEADELERAALQDVVEVERAARDFYFSRLDEIHDESTRHLFRQLAHQAARQVDAAEALLGDQQRRAGVFDMLPHVKRTLPHFAQDTEAVPTWEGTSDYSARKRHV